MLLLIVHVRPVHSSDARVCTCNPPARFNPWRAPGSAPVFDACGRAAGAGHKTAGEGYYIETDFAKMGDKGSELPKQPSGAVWKVGSVVESWWSIRANHGARVSQSSSLPPPP